MCASPKSHDEPEFLASSSHPFYFTSADAEHTPFSSAVRSCFLALNAEFTGHQALNIVAPETAVDVPSSELAKRFYPGVPLGESYLQMHLFYLRRGSALARLLECFDTMRHHNLRF